MCLLKNRFWFPKNNFWAQHGGNKTMQRSRMLKKGAFVNNLSISLPCKPVYP